MGFTEHTFLFVFMPMSIVLYCIINGIFHNNKANNALLVVLSLLFYLWASKESFMIFMTIGVFTYMTGLIVERPDKKQKIIFPLVCLVGILVFYKFYTAMAFWINRICSKNIINIGNLIIPIGLSFVVFEAISYIVDIYRGDAEAGTLLDCFTYLSLFPKLVSGPIVLWKDFSMQLKNRKISLDQISLGVDRIIIGYAKKAIIADTFGSQINLINSGISSGGVDIPTIWLKVFLYCFQLYFDFSGYSDIAIGLCNIFGFKIKNNFDNPYISKSITEFWRRWHISLGTWFREYIYIPLGGNKQGNVFIHLAIVFLITGIWHGVGWVFIFWGGIHGLCVIIERIIRNTVWYKKTPSLIKWLFTMVVVFSAWILFMSKNRIEALQTYISLFVPMTTKTVNFTWQYYASRRIIILLIISVISIICGLEKIQIYIQRIKMHRVGAIFIKVLLLMLFAMDILFIVNSSYSPFLYFQF